MTRRQTLNAFAWWREWWNSLNWGARIVVAWIVLLFAIATAMLVASSAWAATGMFSADNNPLWIALAVMAVSGAGSPLLLVYVSNRSTKKYRHEDIQRQNTVASLLVAANERSAAGSKVIVGKLDVIHTLVNSSMTEALKNERTSKIAQSEMLLEIIELKKARGEEPSAETIANVKEIKDRIVELDTIIADRMRQTTLAEVQAQNIHLQGELDGRDDVRREMAEAAKVTQVEKPE